MKFLKTLGTDFDIKMVQVLRGHSCSYGLCTYAHLHIAELCTSSNLDQRSLAIYCNNGAACRPIPPIPVLWWEFHMIPLASIELACVVALNVKHCS